jgi:hypothetical protein
LSRSIAALSDNNGRIIVVSRALAIKARRSYQQASNRRRASNARSHGSSARAIATIVLPQLRLRRLDRARWAQRLIQPCRRKSNGTFTAAGGGVNRKMDNLTRD